MSTQPRGCLGAAATVAFVGLGLSLLIGATYWYLDGGDEWMADRQARSFLAVDVEQRAAAALDKGDYRLFVVSSAGDRTPGVGMTPTRRAEYKRRFGLRDIAVGTISAPTRDGAELDEQLRDYAARYNVLIWAVTGREFGG